MTLARQLPISLAALMLATAALAQPAAKAAAQKERDARKDHAVENCKANRGVDCETPQGIKEWEMLERSRAEAVRDGSRRRIPAPATR